MASEQEYFENEPKRRNSFATIGLIAAVLVAVLALLFFFVLNGLGTGAEEEAAPAPAPKVEVDKQPAEEQATKSQPKESKASKEQDEEVAKTERKAPVETFEVFASKDPFEPAVSESTGSDGGATNGDGTGTAGAKSDSNTTDTVGGHTVSVVSVSERNQSAQVQVDSTVFNAREGRTFADNYELVATSGDCADLLYGDDQFTLCEGEQILK